MPKPDVAIDFNSLKVGELIDLEEATGFNFSSMRSNGKEAEVPLKVVTAFVWLLKRRSDPEFTFEKARELDLDEIGAEIDRLTPKEPPKKRPTRGSS